MTKNGSRFPAFQNSPGMTMTNNNEQQKRGDRTPIWRHAAKVKTMEGKCREGP